MKKILHAFFIVALLQAGFLSISRAQEELLKDEAIQQDDIEQNVNDMLKLLEELQNDKGMSNEWLSPKDEVDKTEEPEPLEQVAKPGKKSKPTPPVEKNNAEYSIETTDEVVRFEPNDPDSHFKLGLEYWSSKNLDEAIHQFQEVVRLDPENAHAYWNLGLLYDENNQGPEAIAHIKKAEGIYSKYDYPAFVAEAKKRLRNYSEKYGIP